jgi:replicative DNA helicase
MNQLDMATDSSKRVLPFITIEEAARQELRYIRGRMSGDIKSLLTPWRKFNQASMNGIEWGSIITVAGMSGSGKTAILNELETGLFEKNPKEKFAVLSFNFEMMARRLVGRKISRNLNVSVKQMYHADIEEPNKNLSAEQYKKAVEYAQKVKTAPVWYVDMPGTVPEIVNTVEYFGMHMEENLDRGILVTLDHSILVKKLGEQKTLDVLYELAGAFNGLKKKIKSSYIIVSQLNRGIETVDRIQNKNLHYPQKSDVFGADALYQYSDVFMVTHRPEMLGIRQYGIHDWDTNGLIYWHYLKTRDGDPLTAKMKNLLKYNQVIDFD